MGLGYCDVLCSWLPEQVGGTTEINSVFEYNVAQSTTTEGESSELSQTDTDSHGEEEVFCQLVCDKTLTESNHYQPCMMNIICKSQYNVCILGINILSESRTQEIYNEKEDYLLTTSCVQKQYDKQDNPIFYTEVCWSKPRKECNIKFLSLKGKESFRVYKVAVQLVQGSDNTSSSQPVQYGSIDMNKVKEMVGSSGTQLSDRAKAFMTTMEQYQQNKEATLSGMERLLKPSSGDNGTLSGNMSKFMTMFTSMNKLQSLNQSNSNGVSSLPLVSPMTGSVNGEKSPAMLSFLRDICGKVSKIRETEVQVEEITPDVTNKSEESAAVVKPPDVNIEQLEEMLIKQIQAMESRMEKKMDEKLKLMEERVTRKLDRILTLLSIPDGRGMSDSSEETSSSSELTLD